MHCHGVLYYIYFTPCVVCINIVILRIVSYTERMQLWYQI